MGITLINSAFRLLTTTSLAALVAMSGSLAASATQPASDAVPDSVDQPLVPSVPELGTSRQILSLQPFQLEAKIKQLSPAQQADVERALTDISEDASSDATAPSVSQRSAGSTRVLATTLMGFRGTPYSLPDFISYRANNWNKQPTLNWNTDGCSVPAVARETIKLAATYASKFQDPCVRHDFGYRNFGGKSSLKLDPSSEMRARIDGLLLTDMRTKSSSTTDNVAASAFYTAVRAAGHLFY